MQAEIADPSGAPAAATRRVAVFDLDETLTRHDTFLPFLRGYLRRHPTCVLGLLWLPIRVVRGWLANRRTGIKRAVLVSFAGGQPRQRLLAWAQAFVDDLLEHGMRPAALDCVREHLAVGDRVILATASLDIYVEPLARRLGIEEVVCSRVAWTGDDRLAGMNGLNCRDAEKLARVRAVLGDGVEPTEVIMYSDSHADLPLLSWAGQGVAVSPTRKLAALAEKLGLDHRGW